MNACLIIIGNEILSGRTQDKNLSYIANGLNEIGVRLAEVRVIPDHEPTIIETVNACRARFGYVFTSGGIGPTHDDITTAAIARAFGVPVIRHPEAERRLLAHYTPDQVNEARMKMADVPQGATLIDNPVSAAPGFRIENVFVLAGVPRIMQAMFDGIKGQLKGGPKILSRTLSAHITEGTIAADLTAIQQRYETVEIGSYPFMRDGKLGTSLVARSSDEAQLAACHADIAAMLARFGAALLVEE
jgi:molybdenum cofactor synthesis domain-containing protein